MPYENFYTHQKVEKNHSPDFVNAYIHYMKKISLILLPAIFGMEFIQAQQTISLYDGNVPNSRPYYNKEKWEPQDNGDTIVHLISQPTLTIFLPQKANGTAVVICPGG